MASPSASFPSPQTDPLTGAPAPYGAAPIPATTALEETLPRSAQTILSLLATQGPQTHKDLVQNAGLPARTIRWAVHRLREEGLVQARLSIRDPRQSYFFLAPAQA